jgi:prepilin-type N-terminal cleavage/methylation domain-containing protein
MIMKPEEQGFTLVELLVAMVAGSFLLASLSWAIAMLGRDLKVDTDASVSGEIARITPMLKSMLESAALPMADGSGFEGTPTGLVATVPPPRSTGSTGSMRLTLRVAASSKGHDLVARLAPLDLTAQWPATMAADNILATGFDDIRFEYRQRDMSDGPRLPALIVIIFTRGAAQARIAIAPWITASGSCHFDPISLECRK